MEGQAPGPVVGNLRSPPRTSAGVLPLSRLGHHRAACGEVLLRPPSCEGCAFALHSNFLTDTDGHASGQVPSSRRPDSLPGGGVLSVSLTPLQLLVQWRVGITSSADAAQEGRVSTSLPVSLPCRALGSLDAVLAAAPPASVSSVPLEGSIRGLGSPWVRFSHREWLALPSWLSSGHLCLPAPFVPQPGRSQGRWVPGWAWPLGDFCAVTCWGTGGVEAPVGLRLKSAQGSAQGVSRWERTVG